MSYLLYTSIPRGPELDRTMLRITQHPTFTLDNVKSIIDQWRADEGVIKRAGVEIRAIHPPTNPILLDALSDMAGNVQSYVSKGTNTSYILVRPVDGLGLSDIDYIRGIFRAERHAKKYQDDLVDIIIKVYHKSQKIEQIERDYESKELELWGIE